METETLEQNKEVEEKLPFLLKYLKGKLLKNDQYEIRKGEILPEYLKQIKSFILFSDKELYEFLLDEYLDWNEAIWWGYPWQNDLEDWEDIEHQWYGEDCFWNIPTPLKRYLDFRESFIEIILPATLMGVSNWILGGHIRPGDEFYFIKEYIPGIRKRELLSFFKDAFYIFKFIRFKHEHSDHNLVMNELKRLRRQVYRVKVD